VRCRRSDERPRRHIASRWMRSTTLEGNKELAGARKAALDELFDTQGPDGNQDRQLPVAPRGRRRGRIPEARAGGPPLRRSPGTRPFNRATGSNRLRPDRLSLMERARRLGRDVACRRAPLGSPGSGPGRTSRRLRLPCGDSVSWQRSRAMRCRDAWRVGSVGRAGLLSSLKALIEPR